MDLLQNHIEALVFATSHVITLKELKICLEQTFETIFEKEEIERSLCNLQEKYRSDNFAIEIVEISGGFQFMTKGIYHSTIGNFLKQKNVKRLSTAALETLSIIAYKQPVVKSEVEKIRGVSCDYSIQKLLEKELVEIKGKSDLPGKPLIYATSGKFMDYFGLKSIKDLPQLKDIQTTENQIGEPAPMEEVKNVAMDEEQ